MDQKFYICKHCGKIVALVKESGVPVVCCGEVMQQIIPSSNDASIEKHVPSYEVKDNKVFVKVGSIPHPMTEDHFIEWVSIQTNKGNQRKLLTPNTEPEVVFALLDNEVIENVYAYCNLHSLWQAK